jgi:hypothetical protein
MEYDRIPTLVDEINSNPHCAEGLNKSELFDLIKYVKLKLWEIDIDLEDKFKNEVMNPDIPLPLDIIIIRLRSILAVNSIPINLKFELDKYLYVLDAIQGCYTKRINNEETIEREQVKEKKLKWCGKPSHLAFIINELVEKGFIDSPKSKGDTSYKKLADEVLSAFDVDTTEQNMQKELNPNKNTVGDFNRMKITIPNISDLA